MSENFIISYNKKCPICLEKCGEFFFLPCNHKLHLECCIKLTSLDCPLCRTIMSNLPDDLKTIIEDNIQKYKDETNEMERVELSNRYINAIRGFLTFQPTPQMEAIAALDYLRENGIPLQFLPPIIEITLFNNYMIGTFFNCIINMVISMINETISDNESDDEDEDYVWEEDEDEIERVIRVRKI